MEEQSRKRAGKLATFLGIMAASSALVYISGRTGQTAPSPISLRKPASTPRAAVAADIPKPYPEAGVTLPVRWGDLGRQLVSLGVIDRGKLEALYSRRGGIDQGMQALLGDIQADAPLTISPKNAGFVLNLLWALGLANQSPVLDSGPMTDAKYGGAGNFASTGGWSLGAGSAMDHFSKHRLISLTASQESLVERVAKQVYRPCCDNPTYFPDCNHGMAMLGLLELLASQGSSEQQMYQSALAANYYWFPQQYQTAAEYFKETGGEWSRHAPQEILGKAYSSGSGYGAIVSKVRNVPKPVGGSCGA